jgi:hypothetical protein
LAAHAPDSNRSLATPQAKNGRGVFDYRPHGGAVLRASKNLFKDEWSVEKSVL